MSMQVSILIRQGYPLNRQLDTSAGELVLKKIEAMGVEVKTRYSPDDMVLAENDQGEQTFKGFKKGDQVSESDMVIFAVGIKPRDDLAVASGIKTASGGGIEVGDDLQTSAEGVYAIGECASWRGNVSRCLIPHGPSQWTDFLPSFMVSSHRESKWPTFLLSTWYVYWVPTGTSLAKCMLIYPRHKRKVSARTPLAG